MTVNGVSIHYQVAGQGGPVVVLLHEMGGTLDSWDAVAPGLAETFQVVRYDQRGAGLSEKVRKPFSNDDAVDDLEGVLKTLGLKPPYSFVCVAAASTQVLRFLERHPEQVKSIVLCNPAPGVDPSRAGALNERADLAEKEGMAGVMGITLDKSYPPTLGEPAAYEAYRGRYLANDPVGFGLAHRMLARTNMLHMLPKVTVPTLVVAGKHDSVRPPAGTEELAKKIPGARFELIEEAGHFLPTTGPKTLLKLLNEFLPR
ncbi:MAG: 3-oxoadipate enol-lactonase [Alphaproteobacteria bacterium]|jgi:3-oxoadipate enol-lactonase|nr:3-oxoadipate enol-lactonase [Alphaproteobacteria bacterium]